MMNTAPVRIPPSTNRGRGGKQRSRRKGQACRQRLQWGALEYLEPRTLLATIPAATVLSRNDLSNARGDESSPSIAVDPANPQKLVAVWVRNDPSLGGDTKVLVQGAYSTNGGANWFSFSAVPVVLLDPATSNPVKAFAQVTDASVAFDRNDKFYVLTSQHSADNASGAIVLNKFDFSGGSPSVSISTNQVYSWNRSADSTVPEVLSPILAVDDNLSTFTDPDTGQTQTDSNAGNVYISWILDTPPPQNPPSPWNRWTIELLSSIDGGSTFGPRVRLSGGNVGPQHYGAPRLTVSQGTADGRVQGGQVTVVWDDFGTGASFSPPVDFIQARTAQPDGMGGFTLRSTTTVATTLVMGNTAGAFPLRPVVSPDQGIGPAPTIASDNTLGSFSPYQGRLYVAYVGHTRVIDGSGGGDANPADNTDIELAVSDDGGLTWQHLHDPWLTMGSTPVNDDVATSDGFSEASSRSGRPQFQPALAVDQSTGTLVVSFYDARYDAARARPAMFIATSIDGGQTFGPEIYANPSQTATDAITGQTVILGPIPENESAGNANKDATFSFGSRQGLAVANGHVYPAWASNFNQITNNGQATLDIRVANVAITAGPRIISSTMGPVGEPDDTLNNTRAADGTPQASSFIVTFDRPVDPSTFLPGNVTVTYRSVTTSGTSPGINVPVTSVTPLDNGSLGATQFLVQFVPQSGTGTYSYAISPNVSDRIRTEKKVGDPIQLGNAMDQNADGNPGQGSDVYATPKPNGSVSFDQNTLPLIVPGPHVLTSFIPNQPKTGDNLVLNNTVSSIDVVFDRNMNPATFETDGRDILRIMGPAGLINGPFTVTPDPNGDPGNPDPDPTHPRTFRISFPKQELSGTYTISLGPDIQDARGNPLDSNLNAGVAVLRGFDPNGTVTPVTVSTGNVSVPIPDAVGSTPGVATSTINVTDNFLIQGLTLTLNISHTFDPDLEASLIFTPAGGGTPITITLFTNVGQAGGAQGFFNTVFDDAAQTPIAQGGRPFFGTFNPKTPLSVLKNMGSAGTYTLQIKDDTPGNTGTLTNWSLTFQKPVPGTGLGEPVADRATVSFRIFTMDPTNPLASNTWTAVGPAPIGTTSGGEGDLNHTGGSSGRIGGIAVDPSDPSGNTVYIAGASGGIWKTTNFLDPAGPTYIPLTDFGPTFGINIGGLAVFGRNNDPNQSIVFAATGEGDTSSPGVGFLRSMDGGATWTLLDSLDNTKPFNQRDHTFATSGGTHAYKIVVDPRPSIDGNVIVYAALSGSHGGLWRSLDSGEHWQLMRAGQATDVVLDPNSGTGVQNGNLQLVYAAFAGDGVYLSPNQGQVWNKLLGGVGVPLIQNVTTGGYPVPVANTAPGSPGAGQGRIVLAKPFLTGNPIQDLQYEGWLYALVVTPGGGGSINSGGSMNGLYLTKDFGQNWTKVLLKTIPPATIGGLVQLFGVPTNDPTKTDYDPFAGPPGSGFEGGQGNYDVSLAIDPTNPNVVYVGGTLDGPPSGYLRIDTTGLSDPHALVGYDNSKPDGGLLMLSTTGRVTANDPNNLPAPGVLAGLFPVPNWLNLIRNPFDPFNANATISVVNSAQFTNTGANAKWIPFDIGGTDQHRVVTMVDPVTGHARIIIGDDQGVFTTVDNNGTFQNGIGTAESPIGSRNGNLQITQFYYGAAQPSNLAAQIAGAMFYGSAQDNGGPFSSGDVLTSGDINWSGPGGDAAGVATDQQGKGTLYQYWWPCCGGGKTDFFQVNGIGRTFGLLQQSNSGPVPDPQWPFTGGSNFAVNPLNGDQIIISSQAGRIFGTETQGKFWNVIGDPGALDGTYAPALAYGAPDPNGPAGIGNLDNFLYAGTSGGHVYITQTGGGANGNQWINVSSGLDGSPLQMIVTNPTRGSHEAYAVTSTGVFHITDSLASGATWQKITGNLFQIKTVPFGDASMADFQLKYLTAIQADWRYVIPDDLSNPSGPTHPMLYVAGEGGVFRSYDNGKTWTPFPDASLNGAPVDGGYLPNAHVTDLDMSLGNIDPTTGRPDVSTGPNILLATTYGRGMFAIRLAPIVFPNQDGQPRILGIDPASDSGLSNTDQYTNVTNPIVDGLSEQTAFGSRVRITLYDLTDPNNPRYIGGYDGTPNGATDVAANWTDAAGRFSVQVNAGAFASDGSSDGLKTIGVQATDLSGTKGNMATFQFTLDTTPPADPLQPLLLPASDTGLSNNDQITNLSSNLQFQVNFSLTEQNTQVTLFRNGGAVGTPQQGNGTVTIVDPGPVSPDGTYAYKAQLVDLAGNTSNFSSVLLVRVDTQKPATPAAPILDPNNPSGGSDSGVVGDNITNVTQPFFTGTAEANTLANPNDPMVTQNNQIQLVQQDSLGNVTVVGTASIASNGLYSVKPTNPLTQGSYDFRVRVLDVAGNLSDLSPIIHIQILQPNIVTPTLKLVAADDSGVVGDNITNVKRPRLSGTGQPGFYVQLIDVLGNITGTPGGIITPTPQPPTQIFGNPPIIVANDGTFTVQFPNNLSDGTYQVEARTSDIAGNYATSNIVTLQILTIGPNIQPSLMLAPSDDTGIKGDNTTSLRRPHLIGTTSANAIVDLIGPTGTVLDTQIADAMGNFVLQLPNVLANGTIPLQARVRDIAGNSGPLSNTLNLKVVTIGGDYNTDGKADPATYTPGTGQYSVGYTGGGTITVPSFGGTSGDIPFQGDFDGDGKTDLGFFRPSTSTFFIQQSQNGLMVRQFGQGTLYGGRPVLVVGDFDGDGRADFGVFQPSTSTFYLSRSSAGNVAIQFGQGTLYGGNPVPVVADYDGDGKADLAVFQPTTATWYIRQSSNNQGQIVQFGQGTLYGGTPVPIPSDFDGDHKADLAIYQAPLSSGQQGAFLIRQSATLQGKRISLGASGDIPVPQDYDGDGKADAAVYTPSTSLWTYTQSSNGQKVTRTVGLPLDVPVPMPYAYSSSSSTGGGSTLSVPGGPGLGGGAATQSAAGLPGVGGSGGGPSLNGWNPGSSGSPTVVPPLVSTGSSTLTISTSSTSQPGSTKGLAQNVGTRKANTIGEQRLEMVHRLNESRRQQGQSPSVVGLLSASTRSPHALPSATLASSLLSGRREGKGGLSRLFLA